MLSATKTLLRSWIDLSAPKLRELADQPIFLVLVLLAANAAARPYAGIVHDSYLYSFQVLNQAEHGAFSNDLFFRYGSQDQYSLFSRLMVPLVNVLGLKLAFFVVYLASNALFILGLVRLVSRLVDDSLLRIASLVYMVIAPLNYGGLYTFLVQENFLTPRLPAAGLVLLGLAALSRKRYLVSLAFMVLAGLLHPLIATGGFLTWGGVLLVDKIAWRRAAVATIALSLAGAVFLAVPAVASEILGGDMDEVWRHAVFVCSPYNFASSWEIRDWGNVFVSGVVVVAGLFLFRKDDRSAPTEANLAALRIRLTAVVGLVGLAAVAGSILAESSRYALLLQGQPYRALWILKVFQVPLCFLLSDWLLRAKNNPFRPLAFLPLIFLLGNDSTSRLFTVSFIPSTLLMVRGLRSQPRRDDWLVRIMPWAVLQGELAACLYREAMLVRAWSVLLNQYDAFALLHVLLESVGIVPWMLVVFASIGWLCQRKLTRYSPGLALGIFLVVQTGSFVLSESNYVRARTSDGADAQFAREFLKQRQGELPTVYSDNGQIDFVWQELRANNFFVGWQRSGGIFRRQTAMEGERRAAVVGPFEIQRCRRTGNLEEIKFFQTGQDFVAPTVADLARVCAEPELDYAILQQDFPGLCSATNGRVYVYDCRNVRAQLNLPTPTPQPGLAVGQSRHEDRAGTAGPPSPARNNPNDPS